MATLFIYKGEVNGRSHEVTHIGEFLSDDENYEHIVHSKIEDYIPHGYDLPYLNYEIVRETDEKFTIQIYKEICLDPEIIRTVEVQVIPVLSFLGRYFRLTELEVEL